MNTPLERAQGRTLKEISSVLSTLHRWGSSDYARSAAFQWRRDQMVRSYSQQDPDKAEECKALMDWAINNQQELEVFMAKRSPGTAATWAVRANRRLCEEAERIVREKAKDRSTLLDYCSHFGILLDDLSKITMRAAFGEDSLREKAYIKKLEHTRKKFKEFLGQMVKVGQVDPNISVRELMEVL